MMMQSGGEDKDVERMIMQSGGEGKDVERTQGRVMMCVWVEDILGEISDEEKNPHPCQDQQWGEKQKQQDGQQQARRRGSSGISSSAGAGSAGKSGVLSTVNSRGSGENWAPRTICHCPSERKPRMREMDSAGDESRGGNNNESHLPQMKSTKLTCRRIDRENLNTQPDTQYA
ncbi:hypothetical protein Pmani_016391 [Petrolisthes manimaculis]|uniref:Uncharacterized protein n=1 Tax=Petrolisthes manimaculis TaxID=1843537 RepID=A0AAE1PRV1_9EUCA|nr:hypothetical protein Pmani_016391 [Petrolisthes manimaculis]